MNVKQLAYLTMANTDGWSIDADLGFPPLQQRGWQINGMPWQTQGVDWNRYTAVYIGVPWDYPEDPERFLAVLGDVERSSALLVNPLPLVHWSLAKTYLRDLEAGGAPIVPSLWFETMDLDAVRDAFDHFDVPQLIIKPVVSTNATDTFLLDREQLAGLGDTLTSTFAGRGFVIQAYIDNIADDGEYSLFYFNRHFSHAIRKVPKRGDFRVQEEHGSSIGPVAPGASLLAAGERAMHLVDPCPVYARADFVRGPDGEFLVMELELIEPSMYLRMDAGAPERFAAAFDEYVSARR